MYSMERLHLENLKPIWSKTFSILCVLKKWLYQLCTKIAMTLDSNIIVPVSFSNHLAGQNARSLNSSDLITMHAKNK